jgi:hypothetical protein
MGDDEAALHSLWREKRGEEEPEDLSSNLIVQLGVVTEHLNRQWYERNTGLAIKDVQRRVHHPVVRWMAATLDGVVEATGAIFEAKFMLPYCFLRLVNLDSGVFERLNRYESALWRQTVQTLFALHPLRQR